MSHDDRKKTYETAWSELHEMVEQLIVQVGEYPSPGMVDPTPEWEDIACVIRCAHHVNKALDEVRELREKGMNGANVDRLIKAYLSVH